MSLPTKKRLVSVRAKVAQNTAVNSPVTIDIQLQNPIIEKLIVYSQDGTIYESGFRMLVNGIQAFPAVESVATPDMVNESNFLPLPSAPVEIETGIQVPGSPYKVQIQFYNLDAATPYYATIGILTAPKIDLPKMPIENDRVSKESEIDS